MIPYIRSISEKFWRIGNCYNIRTIFKTKQSLRGTLMTTRPDRGLQQTRQCVYSIPCECGRCYIDETSRRLEVHIKEHKHNFTQGLLEKSRLAQHAYEEGHRICWNEDRVLQIEPNIICRKYKEPAHMSLLVNQVWTYLLSGSRSSVGKLESYYKADLNVPWDWFLLYVHLINVSFSFTQYAF
jgi:hypothetical protein